jgi:glycolate oxidase iron-sulfur subunit
MRALLKPGILAASDQQEAQSILRACVHCGFCNATCPSYQVLADERDGPRGRLYLMKHLLEGGDVSAETREHLDRCLGCKACETTCPSGVRYSRLLDIIRPEVDARAPRNPQQRFVRWLLRKVVPSRWLFGGLLHVGRALRPLLPRVLAQRVPARPPRRYPRRVSQHVASERYGFLPGCVQDTAAPQINEAAALVFESLEMALVRTPGVGCCGALALHLGATDEAQAAARRNIDSWLPLIEQGTLAGVVSTSSGCTQVLKDYGHLLRHDADYAERAARFSSVIHDATELIDPQRLASLNLVSPVGGGERVAVQCPCSLQHGLKAGGRLEALLGAVGFEPTPVADGHLCCGSAGTYSLLQPAVARELRERKLAALSSGSPDVIATANIGCQLHLSEESPKPVRHWLELLANRLAGSSHPQ